ncbi:MAG: hypothetical protein ACOCXJ_09480, partial [Planctomycetota bacterium]
MDDGQAGQEDDADRKQTDPEDRSATEPGEDSLFDDSLLPEEVQPATGAIAPLPDTVERPPLRASSRPLPAVVDTGSPPHGILPDLESETEQDEENPPVELHRGRSRRRSSSESAQDPEQQRESMVAAVDRLLDRSLGQRTLSPPQRERLRDELQRYIWPLQENAFGVTYLLHTLARFLERTAEPAEDGHFEATQQRLDAAKEILRTADDDQRAAMRACTLHLKEVLHDIEGLRQRVQLLEETNANAYSALNLNEHEFAILRTRYERVLAAIAHCAGGFDAALQSVLADRNADPLKRVDAAETVVFALARGEGGDAVPEAGSPASEQALRDRYEAELADLRSELERLRQAQEDHPTASDADQDDTALGEERERRQQLEQELSTLREEEQRLHAQHRRTQEQLDQLDQQQQEALQERDALRKECQRLEGALAAAREQGSSTGRHSRERLEQLQGERDDLRERLQQSEAQRLEQVQELEERQARLEHLETEASQAAASASDLERRLQESQRRLGELEGRYSELEELRQTVARRDEALT